MTRRVRNTAPGRARTWQWQDSAACRGEELALFFGADRTDRETQTGREAREAKAKEICAACPVRTDCLDHAISRPEKYGTWGGLNEDELTSERRRRLRRGQAAGRRAGVPRSEADGVPAAGTVLLVRALAHRGVGAPQIARATGVNKGLIGRMRQPGNEPTTVTRQAADAIAAAYPYLLRTLIHPNNGAPQRIARKYGWATPEDLAEARDGASPRATEEVA